MAKYGRTATADKSFPEKTHTTIEDKVYDDPGYLQANLALNYVAYTEIHSEFKTSVTFQEAIENLIHVSLFNIPLGYPIVNVKDEICVYGHIHTIVQIKKTILSRSVPIGTRAVKFTKIEEPIAKLIRIEGRNIRTIYSGQDEQLRKQQKENAARHRQTVEIREERRQQQQQPYSSPYMVEQMEQIVTDDADESTTDNQLIIPMQNHRKKPKRRDARQTQATGIIKRRRRQHPKNNNNQQEPPKK